MRNLARSVAAETDKTKDSEPREVLRAERSILRLVGVQEILTVMMVVAALSSAVATWKATQVVARGERPYIGVESVRLIKDSANRPYAAIVYQNFGTVPSTGTTLEAWTTVDGKLVSLNPL